MGKLIYGALASLDGYIEDENGSFDWAVPDPEVHAFLNNLSRPNGTCLYGRRMYEVMSAWETLDAFPDPTPEVQDYATIWRAAEKVVYSQTLQEVSSARTRIERQFDADAVRRMKAAAEKDIEIGGPELASHAFRAGLIDECFLILAPVTVGGGKKALPDGVRLNLDLREERRFANGMVYLSYRVIT